MNEETLKKWTDEANQILKERIGFMEKYYRAVRDAFQNHYDWPDLDTLRHEISLCIMLGLFQAAITLTNHFLESLLKYALIAKESENNLPEEADVKGRLIDSLVEQYAEPIKKYDPAKLGNNINRACTLGLITKEQKKQLGEFRKYFRNAYSHADKGETFGDQTVPWQGVRLEDDGLHLDQKGEPLAATFPIGQSLIQAMQAETDAPDYFLYMDKLARQIREKLFGPIENE